MPELVFFVSRRLDLTILLRPSCALQPCRLRLAALFGERGKSVVHQLYAMSYDALQSQHCLATLLESCSPLVKTNMPKTTHSSPAEAAIRPATFADIDDLVAVYKASSPLDQTFPYVNQHAQQYPEDLIKYEKLLNHLWISPKYSNFHVMVAEAPSLEDVTVTKVIAYAVWDVSYRNKRQYGSEYKSQNGKVCRNPPTAAPPSSFS